MSLALAARVFISRVSSSSLSSLLEHDESYTVDSVLSNDTSAWKAAGCAFHCRGCIQCTVHRGYHHTTALDLYKTIRFLMVRVSQNQQHTDRASNLDHVLLDTCMHIDMIAKSPASHEEVSSGLILGERLCHERNVSGSGNLRSWRTRASPLHG